MIVLFVAFAVAKDPKDKPDDDDDDEPKKRRIESAREKQNRLFTGM